MKNPLYCKIHGKTFKDLRGLSAHMRSRAHAQDNESALNAAERAAGFLKITKLGKDVTVAGAIYELESKAAELQEKLDHVQASIEILRGN